MRMALVRAATLRTTSVRATSVRATKQPTTHPLAYFDRSGQRDAPSPRDYARHATRSLATWGFLPTTKRRGPRESTPPPPPLPDTQTVRVATKCTIEYIDLQPSSGPPEMTLVLLHGAPGTFEDFRHLIPHLQQELPCARIVGINFPGFGGSTVDEAQLIKLLDAQRAAALTLAALRELLGQEESVFLLGHSFGGHAAIDVATQNITSSEQALGIRGLVLLAAAGMHPHRVLRPRASRLVIGMLEVSPLIVQKALSLIIKAFYSKLLLFPPNFPACHYVAGIVRAGTTDFGAIRTNVARLRTSNIPSFSAWSSDDEFMEDEIPIVLAAALGSTRRLAFGGAGHNLQKTRAAVLAKEIASWMQRLEDHSNEEAGEARMEEEESIESLP